MPGISLICAGDFKPARVFRERGVEIVGYDLSSKMVEAARVLNPEINFHQADMTILDHADETWAGLVAFYSIIHIPPSKIAHTLREFRRILRPDGLLFLAFHIGGETLHLDDWWEHKVSIDFYFFQREAMTRHLQAAGFEIEESIEREPYPEVEHQSRRAYIFARRLSTTEALSN